MEKDKITAYFLRVSEDGETIYAGYLGEIENTLEAKQRYVSFGKSGGLIQCASLTDGIDLICNDEGKLLNFPPNRAWFYKGRMADLICGNILCVRHDGDVFTSIREGDIPAIEEHLKPVCGMEGLARWHGPPDIGECRARYQKGTRLRLTKDLDDPSGLKKEGDVCVVDYVDDAGNIHVLWESGGSQPFFIGVDSFEEVEKIEESKP